MKLRILGALVSSAIFALLLGVAPAAAKEPAGPLFLCSGYEVYFYEYIDFNGQSLHVCYGTSYADLRTIGWNDRASSLELNHAAAGQGLIVYWDINYGGSSWRILREYQPQ